MKTAVLGVGLFLSVVGQAAFAQQSAFDPYIGRWSYDATWSGTSTFHSQIEIRADGQCRQKTGQRDWSPWGSCTASATGLVFVTKNMAGNDLTILLKSANGSLTGTGTIASGAQGTYTNFKKQ